MNIQEEVLEAQHQEWLKHPVTCSLLKVLNNQHKLFLSRIANDVYNKDVSSEIIRYHCVCIKNSMMIHNVITDFATLKNSLKNTNEN